MSLTACALLVAKSMDFVENIDTLRDMNVVCAGENGRIINCSVAGNGEQGDVKSGSLTAENRNGSGGTRT